MKGEKQKLEDTELSTRPLQKVEKVPLCIRIGTVQKIRCQTDQAQKAEGTGDGKCVHFLVMCTSSDLSYLIKLYKNAELNFAFLLRYVDRTLHCFGWKEEHVSLTDCFPNFTDVGGKHCSLLVLRRRDSLMLTQCQSQHKSFRCGKTQIHFYLPPSPPSTYT